MLSGTCLVAASLLSRPASAQSNGEQDGYLRVAVGPSFLASELSLRTYQSWSQYGAGASAEMAVGARLSPRAVLGGFLSFTGLPSLHRARDDESQSMDLNFSALGLLGPFVDIDLNPTAPTPLYLELGLAAALLSQGGGKFPFSSSSRTLRGGVANVGLRLQLARAGRVSWDLSGRLSAGAVTRDELGYSDGATRATVVLLMPSVLVSLVYR
ncbi:MAG TPA: hypothetical protein VFQ35_07350 [Polyangiaceae bacterium]|nr:hypothetical protein [Polyangiaceae bacterium]